MRVDAEKICFIACVTDELLYSESVAYIRNLLLPENLTIELLAVRGASFMTAGYQEAMEQSDAKYKVYLHQDVFIVNKNFLVDILNIFRQHPEVGMVGLAGAKKLSQVNPIWWNSDSKYGEIYSKKDIESIQRDIFGKVESEYAQVSALDGILLATQYDLPWRTDLFKGWHFYDISQCREFIQAGYKVVVPHQEEPWAIHACGRRGIDEAYVENMNVFCQNYEW